MDMGNNTKMEFGLQDTEGRPWVSIFIKSEPDEYEFIDEDNFTQNNNVVSNNDNSELSKNEKPIIRHEEFKSTHAKASIINHVGIKQNFSTHIEIKEQVFTPTENEGPHKCSLCTEGFSTLQTLKVHMLTHSNNNILNNIKQKSFECDVCFKMYVTMASLRQHKKLHENIQRTPFECDFCKRKFARHFRIEQHIFLHIGDGGEHKCELCGIGFSTSKLLNRHLREHLNYKILYFEPYACTFCHHRFLTRKELTQHLLLHSNMKPFYCKKCGQSFERPSQLEMHRKNHCEGKIFECDICKRKFKSHYWIREHIVSHIGDGGVHKCEVCGVGFSIPTILKRHLRGHLNCKIYKLFECEICKNRFLRAYDLAQHMLLHNHDGAFICVECGKSFKEKASLNMHKKIHPSTRHVNKQTFPSQLQNTSLECNICKTKFKDSYRLKFHTVAHMGDGGPLKCSVCAKGFSIPYVLKIHMREHKNRKSDTVEKSFECDVCKKRFKFEKNLKSHKTVHVMGKSKNSSDGRIIRKQKVLDTVRLKSEIKSEVLDKTNSNGGSEENNLMSERENLSFISVKKEPCATFNLNYDLDIEDIKISLKSER